MIDLKPCPLCNGEASHFMGYDYGKVGCNNDDCNYRNRPVSVEEWNNRPCENKIKAEAVIEAMELVVTSFCSDGKSYIDGFIECDNQWESGLINISEKMSRGEL